MELSWSYAPRPRCVVPGRAADMKLCCADIQQFESVYSEHVASQKLGHKSISQSCFLKFLKSC